jgi:DNA repair exonuclease SbcCD ATPase subunit
MSDLKLRQIAIRNWMTIRNAIIEFPERGLVLVTGSNLASGGKLESVGSGKTALGEAISRTLVGIDGRYSNLGHYSYKSKGDTFVDLSVDLLGKPLNVKMGFKCPEMSATGGALRFKFGDQSEVERGEPSETRQELSSILGITPDLAQWSVYIDGDKLRFNKQSERQAVNLLMTALRQPSWDAYQKRASCILNDAKAALETTTGARQAIHDHIAVLEASAAQAETDLANEKNRLAEAEKQSKLQVTAARAELSANESDTRTLDERQKVIKKRLKELEEAGATEYHRLETEKAGIQTKLSEARIKRTGIIEKRAESRVTWNTAQTNLTEMQDEPDKCPNCGKPWDKAHSAGELKIQSKAVETAKSAYDKFGPQVENVDKNIKDLEVQIKAVEAKVNALRSSQEADDLSYESEQNVEKLDSLKTSVSDIRLRLQKAQQGPDRTELTRRTTILEERKAQAKQEKASLEDAAAKLVEAEALVKVAQYWYDAFGPTGIPNMILSEAIPPLNEIARRISLLMTGGTIEVTYSTSRELAKGGSSSELVINVKNKIGSSRVEGSSKGESGLTNLIIAETLSEVGSVSNRIGYRWYDEILNSQDQVVRRSILTYLKDLAHRLDILIFVVDHHHEAASYADYVLVAEKNEKGTEFFWG